MIGIFFEVTHGFADFLGQTPSIAYLNHHAHEHVHEGFHWSIMVTSAVVALAGIGLAAAFYWPNRKPVADATHKVAETVGLYRLSLNKFFFDEIYQMLFVCPWWPLLRRATGLIET